MESIPQSPTTSTQHFILDQRLTHLLRRGMHVHPTLPDDCPRDALGQPEYAETIDHCLPDHEDVAGILKFFGLNQECVAKVHQAYNGNDNAANAHHHDDGHGARWQHPQLVVAISLAQRLQQLYFEWLSAQEGKYEKSYDGYIIAGIELCGLSPEHAIRCGLSTEDPRYSSDRVVAAWYADSPKRQAADIVHHNLVILLGFWRDRKEHLMRRDERWWLSQGTTD